MDEAENTGPDLVIAGAARSGTSFLAAHLAAHPDLDPGDVKEPNYFSRYFDHGPGWYDGLFSARSAGRVRLDASTSYTYPQFPDALARLARASPDVFVVYLVREPIARAVSHYQYYHHYFRRDPAQDFGAALRAGPYYGQVSDYSVWLPRLRDTFPADRLLVAPFDLVVRRCPDVAAQALRAVGLAECAVAEQRVQAHQNNVVEFRAESMRLLMRRLRRNPAYLRLRSAVGPHRVRRVRSLLTRDARLPTVEQSLSSCDRGQLRELRELEDRACSAAYEHLREQDTRRGLDWARHWGPASELTS